VAGVGQQPQGVAEKPEHGFRRDDADIQQQAGGEPLVS
jgi:hypothetical protein